MQIITGILALLALPLCMPAPQQAPQEPPSLARVDDIGVFDRAGGAHGMVTGRVIETGGEPAVGAKITVYESFPGWNGGHRTLGRARTDAAGAFTLDADLFADAAPVLNVRAAEQFAVLPVPFALTTGGQTDLGQLQLRPFFTIEGHVDWDPPGDRNWIQILDPAGKKIQRGQSLEDDGSFRLDGITPLGAEERTVTVRIFSESRVDRKTTRVSHQTHWTIDERSPRRRLVLTPNGDSLDVVDDEGEEPIALRYGAFTPRVLAGRVVDTEGAPVAGLLVQASSSRGRTLQVDEGARCRTDVLGRFRLDLKEFEAARLWLYSGLGYVGVEFVAPRNPSRYGPLRIVVPPGEEMLIEIPVGRLALPPEAASPASEEKVEVAYGVRLGGRWVEVPKGATAPRLDSESGTILVTPKGHLPRPVQVKAGEWNTRLDLTLELPRRLRVLGPEGAVADARVLLRHFRPHTPAVAVELCQLQPSGPGVFAGYAPTGLRYEAVITAPGFAPKAVIWGHQDLEVQLIPLSEHLVLSGGEPGDTWLLGPAGSDVIWRSGASIQGPDHTISVDVAPGSYDFLCIAKSGQVVAGQTLQVDGDGSPTEVHVREDRRAHALLQLPEQLVVEQDGGPASAPWVAWVRRDTHVGGTAGASAYSTSGGFRAVDWPKGTVKELGPRAREITFNASGRQKVFVSDGSRLMPTDLYREITVPTGGFASAMELRLPPLNAVLLGSMKEFDGGSGFSHHGVAGPRYLLRAATGCNTDTGWSAIGFIPPRLTHVERGEDPDPEFRIGYLPAGEYLWQDHLVETWGRGGRSGLQPVTLQANEETKIDDVGKAPVRTVQLTVVTAEGKPVTGGTVAAVDPMSDAWEAFKRIPSTASMANYPIPRPFTLRLAPDGTCLLPRVRHGHIVLSLDLDSGRRVSAIIEVEALSEEVGSARWTLPAGM